MSVTALYPAQKQFFLRRSKAHFRASHFSMIARLHEMGILGKGDSWARIDPNRSLELICQPALSRLIADRPKENGVSRDECRTLR
jgi:hypothetical protein